MFPFFRPNDDNDEFQHDSSPESHITVVPSDSDAVDSPQLFAGDVATMPTIPEFVFRRSDLPMLNLETDKGDIFRAWKTRWSDYLILSNLCHQDEPTKVRVLRCCMTPESLVILQNLGVPDTPADTTVNSVIKKIEDFADQSINVNLGWHKLTSRNQQEGETISDYVMSLRQLIKDCDTCDDGCKDRAIRVQLIRGVKNQAITEALLKIRKITLTEAIETAMSMEQAKAGGDSLHKEPSINRMSSYQQSKKQSWNQQPGGRESRAPPQSSGNLGQCRTCGGRPHTRNECPAAHAACDFCKEIGHFRRVCPLGRAQFHMTQRFHHHQRPDGLKNPLGHRGPPSSVRRPHQQEQRQWQRPHVNQVMSHDYQAPQDDHNRQEQQDFFSSWAHEMENDEFQLSLRCIRACLSENVPSRKALIECLMFDKKFSVIVLPDSGADVTAVSPDFLQLLGVTRSQFDSTPSSKPTGADGAPLLCLGSVNISWIHNDFQVQDCALVIPGVLTPLLSWSVARDLNLITFNYQPVNDCSLEASVRPIQKVQCSSYGNAALIDEYKTKFLTEFSDVFSDRVMPMKGELFHIRLTPDAVPFCVSAPRTIAFAFREPLRRELQTLQEQDIIEPVTYPTMWCSPIVVEPKNDGVRLCVDFTKLNKFVQREFYYRDPPALLVADISNQQARFFTSLDAKKGYHQCPLDEASRDLTTFITPFGRFRYKRAPFGISSISEHYNRRMDEALHLQQTNTRRQVDDLLVFDKDLRAHIDHVRNILLQCRDAGITLSKEKFKFAKSEATFAGYRITSQGYSIDPKVVEAIQHFAMPKNVTDLRAFFGLVNQLTGTRHDLSKTLEPLRPLLSSKNSFIWTDHHVLAFNEARRRLASAPFVSFFDLRKPTRLLSDASRTGLGFVLQQCEGSTWSTVQAGSRFLSPTETRYAAVELELLAICYAFKKCSPFLQGLHTSVITDHKPLIPILNNKRLDEIENPRLRRMRFYLSQFQLTAQHVQGKMNFAADALSRTPHDPPPKIEFKAPIAALYYVNEPSEKDLVKAIRRNDDPIYSDLRQLLLSSEFPHHRHQLPEHLRPFWQGRDELTVQDDLIFFGNRFLIPRELRSDLLRRLHSAHQGARQTQRFARQFLFWPGMSADIEQFVQQCKKCAHFARTNPKQPLQQARLPDFPFQEVAIDFFQLAGKHFLALTDSFSNWPELHVFERPPSSAMLIAALAPIFARFGAPQVIRCDNGSQFTSLLFRQFLQQIGTQLVTSAPYYPQSNGRAENMVKTLKSIIKKCGLDNGFNQQKISQALWAFRNTPSSTDDLSPAIKLLGRATRGPIPMPEVQLRPPINLEQLIQDSKQKREVRMQNAKRYYDQHAHVLQPVHPGAHVFVRNPRTNEFDSRAVITMVQGRRIGLRFYDGSVSQRDRRDIKCRSILPQPEPYSKTEVKQNNQELKSDSVRKSVTLDNTTLQPTLRRSNRERRPPNRLQF